jgi:two-component system response regulator AtoC
MVTMHGRPLVTAAIPDPSWALAVMGEGVGALHRLPLAGQVSVGRARDAAVPIRHPSLSRRHALLHLGPLITIEDVGSRHGSLLSGRRLVPGKPQVLRPGDLLQLGAVSLILVRAEPLWCAPSR